MNFQWRFTTGRPGAAVQLSTRAGGGKTIVGYASVFYRAGDPSTEFRLSESVVERIMPGAFDRALKEDDVRALFNHDANRVLGRTGSGTCKLTVDATGLRYEITPPNTPTGDEVAELLRRGDVSGSSFAFIPRRSTNRSESGLNVIEVRDVQLFDVGPVVFPAYDGTTAGMGGGTRSAAADRDMLAVELALMDDDLDDGATARGGSIDAWLATARRLEAI